MNKTASPPPATLELGDRTFQMVDLPALAGPHLAHLPVVLRLLMENAARHMRGDERDTAINALFDWLETGTSEAEIAFQPGRLLMHDTTSTPALVDIAAMRDALAATGMDPARLNPTLQVDVSVDHSLAVEAYGQPDAATLNLQHELRRNQERYRFLRWAARSLSGLRIHPPGTGIMHTINLEQLASVVCTTRIGQDDWLVPDMMLGTDSHTPMINGIGVLGWGVGGLEAQTVMFGMPTMLRIPDVIGVQLTGALPAGTTATDLALTVTQRLRQLGVAGEFVEFFGPGVSSLTADDRAVVANMAPEYGATTGFFPVDEQTLHYLRRTGRSARHIEQVRAYLQRAGLWFDPAATPRYTQVLPIALDQVGRHVAGPRRPQDLLDLPAVPAALQALDTAAASTATASHTDDDASRAAAAGCAMPRFPVAIAAITSCTNTSNPALLIAAGLLARKARRYGLQVAAWVKTSLAPGSPAAAGYLARAGLLDDLNALGFAIVGQGCTTCIGNSGGLPDSIVQAEQQGAIRPVAVLSGNRNFPGRIHPDLDLGLLASPPLVVAYALAGDAALDLTTTRLGQDQHGNAVYLDDIWPTRAEVDEVLRMALEPAEFARAFRVASASPGWAALEAPDGDCFPWSATSTTLRCPPFADPDQTSLLGHYTAHPLLVLGDDITTDHISPASAIPADSLVADYLVARGEQRSDLNVFASRRGNWEVMLRAAFHSRSLVNHLAPHAPVAHTIHAPSAEILPLWQAAQRYAEAGTAVVLVAGERYGTGSSRDWAAKGQRLLGIRAVLALSYERIHRSNLIGMGILPLVLPPALGPEALALQPGDRIEVDAPTETLRPRTQVPVRILYADGRIKAFTAQAAVQTRLECQLLQQGGVIPTILQRTRSEAQSPAGISATLEE